MTSPYLLLVRSSSSSIGGLVMPSGAGATPDTGGRAPQLGVRAGGGRGPLGRPGGTAGTGQGPGGGGAGRQRTHSSAGPGPSVVTPTPAKPPPAPRPARPGGRR